MHYVILLRGVNVGGANKVTMRTLREICEQLGYTHVVTYINSGNVFVTSAKSAATIQTELTRAIQKTCGMMIDVLVKTHRAMQKIAAAIPPEWENNTAYKSDVAYLFPKCDREGILATLPIRAEYIDIRYVSGALMWRVRRASYGKSHLNKLIAHPLYKQMTVRNVNTARRLAEAYPLSQQNL